MKRTFILSIIFLTWTLLVWSKFSYADWGWNHAGHHGAHQYYHYHDHPHFGVRVASFYPGEYFSVWAGGTRYYYDDGVYYNYVGGNYVVIAPPVGAVVSTVPSDFQPMLINGMTYYTDNGTYYIHTSSGYQVVTPPAVQTVPAVNIQNTFTVNVPNNRGGFTTVILKKSGNGFLGPQGEFYAAFPRVSELQTVYGR